jgi:hypothetical protein
MRRGFAESVHDRASPALTTNGVAMARRSGDSAFLQGSMHALAQAPIINAENTMPNAG